MADTFQFDYSTTVANTTSINTFTVTTPTNSDFNIEEDDWQWDERLRLINEFDNWTSGTLLNKTDQVWCENENKFVEKPLVVALKSLKNSQDLDEDFLDEIKRHGSLKLDGCRYLVHCRVYGSLPLVAPEVLTEELVDILTTPYAFHRRLLGLDEDSLNGLEDVNDFDSFDEVLNSHITDARYPVKPDIHPFAIYTSDFLLFPNLPTPTNSIPISDSTEEDVATSSFSGVNINEADSAFEEYNTNFPPPELSGPETDTEEDEEVFIPPPSFQITRRKSIAPPPILKI
ncbi:1943_t:CDS:2 [Entrophospora sp. SA101]|nr:1943_t:CDS:2 [Entrophospora sp. SA101]